MPISDPYHSSHYGGYTRDELLLSLQLQFEVLSREVLEPELTSRPPSYRYQCTMILHIHHLLICTLTCYYYTFLRF
ncbi:hypothetical protein Hanom_Chr15g01406981 [Helianthus anomalus]